jgi:N-acylneuraminate cytidylyltransferase
MSLATNNSDVLAVIIGRAGSKGLPGKNALMLAGQPMICHTLEDGQNAACVDRVIVSTDGKAIADAARSMNVDVVMRPAELANDTATVDSAVRHAVETIADRSPIVVILYANVPVRPDDLIDRAVNELTTSGGDSVQSYGGVGKHHPYWMVRVDEDSRVHAHVPNTVYRRQDLPPLHLPDGGVIAVRRESLFNVVEGHPHAFLGTDRRGIISPPGSVVDVDNTIDLAVAEAMLRSQSPKADIHGQNAEKPICASAHQ